MVEWLEMPSYGAEICRFESEFGQPVTVKNCLCQPSSKNGYFFKSGKDEAVNGECGLRLS